MWKEAVWLGGPEKGKGRELDLTGRFAYYLCEVNLEKKGRLELDITANSRYRLWVNERPVLSGPCKGDVHRCYYETADVTDYLKIGKNVFAVQVLYNDPNLAVMQWEERAAIFGVYTPGGGHRLAVEGDVQSTDGSVLATLTTGRADWRVYLDESFYLKSNKVTENLGAVCEEIDFRKTPGGWKKGGGRQAEWVVPRLLESVVVCELHEMVGLLPRFRVQEREIPLLYETEDSFVKELCKREMKPSGILEEKKLVVPKNEGLDIVLDAGVIKNAYPRYVFKGGAGGKVSFTYFEKFVNEKAKEEGRPIHRDDVENGEIVGLTDTIVLNGEELAYEPFWYRTFRFLRIHVETAEEALEMEAPTFRKTGYPLQTKSWVKSSKPWVREVWDMSVRTLENCMMETYMDCPYYEQMQFIMDTRLQAMFTYVAGSDVRMAKKALKDFHYSMLPDGLIHGKYPSAYCQVISTFSLHYIYMMWEYYEQTKDLETVRRYLPDMDIILGYYDRKIGEDGLLGRIGFWEFVDWQEAWKETGGMPAALQKGPSTIINLMYAYALECGARLNEEAARPGMAEEYRARQKKIVDIVDGSCWDEERGMYREGPAFSQYSQHAQAWAVLNGLGDKEKQRRALKNALQEKDVLQCSFSTAYEWFRALEKAGMYEETEENIMRWAALPGQGCTTCPEEPTNGRSECHAWSALPLYEFIRVFAGVRPADGTWNTVRIAPHLEYLPDLEGVASTPKGEITFVYEKVEEGQNDGNLAGGKLSDKSRSKERWPDDEATRQVNILRGKVTIPEGMGGTFVYPNGREVELHGGENLL